MTLAALLVFLPACFALNMAFGPNNLLSVTIGARQGVRAAVLAAFGRLLAFAIMILVVALGLGALMATSVLVFLALKWLGVLYLVWIGWRLWHQGGDLSSATFQQAVPESWWQLARHEFLVAVANPKAMLIFTAFLPQFVDPSQYWRSFMLVGGLFLLLEPLAVLLYALAGRHLRRWLAQGSGVHWINRGSGALMMGFGVMLAFLKRPA